MLFSVRVRLTNFGIRSRCEVNFSSNQLYHTHCRNKLVISWFTFACGHRRAVPSFVAFSHCALRVNREVCASFSTCFGEFLRVCSGHVCEVGIKIISRNFVWFSLGEFQKAEAD